MIVAVIKRKSDNYVSGEMMAITVKATMLTLKMLLRTMMIIRGKRRKRRGKGGGGKGKEENVMIFFIADAQIRPDEVNPY